MKAENMKSMKNMNVKKTFFLKGMKFKLEKYKGEKTRHTCPSCGARRVFARYIDINTGDYLSAEVGRCNRESKCGYHFTPKDYFLLNPQAEIPRLDGKKISAKMVKSAQSAHFNARAREKSAEMPDCIELSILQKTLANYENNSFVQFLFNLFPDASNLVQHAIKSYFVGTTREGRTVFWQIDQKKRIRTGKIIAYDAASGKRRKDVFPTWTHSELKRVGLIKQDFNLIQCFFGEHLLADGGPAAIVEAEKTAVIASMCFPEFVWLAVGAKLNLKAEKLRSLGNRQIILYPDADGFAQWQDVAHVARSMGMPVNVSSLIETLATSEQKANGYDLADYLIDEQRAINEHNSFVDKYNAALDRVLNDDSLMHEVNRRINSQSESISIQSDRVRSIVLDVVSFVATQPANRAVSNRRTLHRSEYKNK